MPIAQIPKVELHRHLDCSMRFTTMLEIAKELGLKLPGSIEEQKKFFLLTDPMDNLGMVLGKFRMAQSLLYNYDVLERLAYETIVEAAHENTKLIELRYSPTFIQGGHSHLQWDQIHSAFLRGIQRAKQTHAIAVGIIIIVQRTLPLTVAEAIVDFAINHKESVVGLDLADNEDQIDAKPFASCFKRAKLAGLHITVHAGEVPTLQSIQNIEDSILLLGAERIGHGIQAIQSPKVLKLLKEQRVCLEVCPTSNYLTQGIKKLNQHPLRALFNEGVHVSVSTDDPGIFNYTLTDELTTVQTVLGFSDDELNQFQQTAFRHSFISAENKAAFSSFFEEP